MTQPFDIDAMRACEMLRVAAKFIRDSAFGGETIFYDDAECDGYCVADDCDAAADVIERSHRAEILRLTAEVERLHGLLRQARDWNWIDYQDADDADAIEREHVPELVRLDGEIRAALGEAP